MDEKLSLLLKKAKADDYQAACELLSVHERQDGLATQFEKDLVVILTNACLGDDFSKITGIALDTNDPEYSIGQLILYMLSEQTRSKINMAFMHARINNGGQHELIIVGAIAPDDSMTIGASFGSYSIPYLLNTVWNFPAEEPLRYDHAPFWADWATIPLDAPRRSRVRVPFYVALRWALLSDCKQQYPPDSIWLAWFFTYVDWFEKRQNRRNPDDNIRNLERKADQTRSLEDIGRYEAALDRAGLRREYEVNHLGRSHRKKYGIYLGHPIQIARANYAHRPVEGLWGRIVEGYDIGCSNLSVREPSKPEEIVHVYSFYAYEVPLPPWTRDIPPIVRTVRRFPGEILRLPGMHGYLKNDPRFNIKPIRRRNPEDRKTPDERIRDLLRQIQQGDLSLLPTLQAEQRRAGLPIYRGPVAHETAQERHARRKWRERLRLSMGLTWLGDDGKLPARTSDGRHILYMFEDGDLACAVCVNDPTMNPLPIAREDLENGFSEQCCMCDTVIGNAGDDSTSEEDEES